MNGAMINQAYLKRALKIAAREVLSSRITASEAEYEVCIQAQIDKWMKEARTPAKPKLLRTEGVRKKVSGSGDAIDRNESYDKMMAESAECHDGDEQDEMGILL
jgi:hypothetical protein